MDKPDDAALCARLGGYIGATSQDYDCRDAAARIEQLVSERDAAVREVDALKLKCKLQRRELRRLNKALGTYWRGFQFAE